MRRVLVIADHAEIREILRETLEAAGYEVAVAGNGREGLETQRRQPADLVITDIFMPEKEGLETIQELRHQSPRPKIIAMSGGGPRLDYLHSAQAFGADRVIDKPFDCEAMVAAVREMLGETG
jgi:DNA-binding response OmpR family regulator